MVFSVVHFSSSKGAIFGDWFFSWCVIKPLVYWPHKINAGMSEGLTITMGFSSVLENSSSEALLGRQLKVFHAAFCVLFNYLSGDEQYIFLFCFWKFFNSYIWFFLSFMLINYWGDLDQYAQCSHLFQISKFSCFSFNICYDTFLRFLCLFDEDIVVDWIRISCITIFSNCYTYSLLLLVLLLYCIHFVVSSCCCYASLENACSGAIVSNSAS